MAMRKEQPTSLVCRNCGTDNPLKAYCCLKCFQVLRPKVHVPFWKVHIRPDASMLTLFIIVSGIGIYIVKRWIDNVEAQVTMNFSSAEYNFSVIADKKKKSSVFSDMSISKLVGLDKAAPENPPTETSSTQTPPVSE